MAVEYILTLFELLLIGIGIHITFIFFNYLFTPFIKRRYSYKRFQRVLLLLKSIGWMLFAVFAFHLLLSIDFLAGASLLVFILLAGLEFWKNAFAGFLLHLEGRLNPGDLIEYSPQTKGKLVGIHTTHVELATAENDSIRIPNHQFRKTPVRQSSVKNELDSYVLQLAFSMDESIETKEKARQLAWNCPWINSSKPVEWTMDEHKQTAKLNVHLIDPVFQEEVKQYFSKLMDRRS